MKHTLNRFLILFFLLTSICPILGLGFLHVNYLHKILNENSSFLKLIEHEEFVLFLIYFVFVVSGISLCLFIFRSFVIVPITEIAKQLNSMAQGQEHSFVPNKKIYSREVRGFIDGFNRMLETLDLAKTQRSDFIATLTHDLKTPLLAEQKAFELLKNYHLDRDNADKILVSLGKNNLDLLNLINTLLDSFKFESGEFLIRKSWVNANDLFEQCLVSLYPLLQEKDIKIDQEINIESPLNIDLAQFKRVLNNILLNTIQNNPPQTKVLIRAFESDGNFHISVEDDGYGIDPNSLTKIFEKYHSSQSDTHTGLGLYVSKLIVKLHGGKISAQSTLDKGTRFDILLPKT